MSAGKKLNFKDPSSSLSLVKAKKKAEMPSDVKPMLATLVDKPIEEEDWLYEVKWDGFRAIAYLEKGKVELRSRNNKSFNDKFYPVFNSLKNWDINTVVDGEILVLNEKGFPDFEALQTWRSEADGHLVFYLFDILWLEGFDLMQVPLHERKQLIQKIVPNDAIIKNSEVLEVSGAEFFKLADQMGLEGIIAKKANSTYTPDLRSKEWLKIKTQKHQWRFCIYWDSGNRLYYKTANRAPGKIKTTNNNRLPFSGTT
jgi:bifunctional non-homologous end joining protein LigD